MSSRKRPKRQAEEEEEEKKTLTVATAKFNIGGKLYEVSKSLLARFPDTILAEKASSCPSPCPIFIDRDQDRFAFCLDYMRDNGKVHLPETISKAALLEELKFFGFQNVDDSQISDLQSKKNCTLRFHEIAIETRLRVAQMRANLKRSKKEIATEELALECLEKSFKTTQKSFNFSFKDFGELDHEVYRDAYFVECCDRLGLCPSKGRSSGFLCLTRNTNAAIQK